MKDSPANRIELNGRAPSEAELAFLALVNYGHFSSMQVQDRCVRGFGRHLLRLASATRELFGHELDVDDTRRLVRQILDGKPASLRVTVFSTGLDRARLDRPAKPDILVATSPPRVGRVTPLRLRSIAYERDLPHIKHVGTFSLYHNWRQARLAGFDDVLFRNRNGEFSEGSTWNIGFWDGERVIWPAAPALPGVTRSLMDEALQAAGVATEMRPVSASDLPAMRSAFVINSGWIGPLVECIDDSGLQVDSRLEELLKACYESRPWEPI